MCCRVAVDRSLEDGSGRDEGVGPICPIRAEGSTDPAGRLIAPIPDRADGHVAVAGGSRGSSGDDDGSDEVEITRTNARSLGRPDGARKRR